MKYINTVGLQDEVEMDLETYRRTRHAAVYSVTTDTTYVIRAVVKKPLNSRLTYLETWIDGRLISTSEKYLTRFWQRSNGSLLNVDAALRLIVLTARNRVHVMDLEVSDHWMKRQVAILNLYRKDFSMQRAIKAIYPQSLTQSCKIQVLSSFTAELVDILATMLVGDDSVRFERLSPRYDNVHIQFEEKQDDMVSNKK